ncbi:MAG: alcohol dehydrogenase AdhP [Nitriliruptor sp.]|nr:MAG: alcohol dehydrogenase AdhP [Nitriliruptor sp.]
MRAAVVRAFGEALEIEDRPIPSPGAHEVLVRMEASGLCHTDIHAWRGDWPVKPSPPFVPGHEGVGIVEALGSDVTRVSEGDRVAIPWLASACGSCEHCVAGWETLCESQENSGYSVDGAYAEHALADSRYVGIVPDGVDPLEAAPLTCAGVTTYKAVKVSGTAPSDLVAVFGIGGLGHLAMQYAQVAGATVVAVDLHDDKLDLARRLGAAHTVNAREQDPIEVIQDLGGADQAICLAVAPKAFEQALASLKRGGTLSMVALPADNHMTLPIFETVLKGITVRGSIVGTRNDLQEVFELHAQGKTTVEYSTRDLATVNEDFESVEAGEVSGRLVFDLTS